MNIETLHIGMKVRHPQYGVGVVKSLTEQTAEIAFEDTQRPIAPASSDLQPAEPTAKLSELEMPLANLIRDTAHTVVEALGLEQQDAVVEGLATRGRAEPWSCNRPTLRFSRKKSRSRHFSTKSS
jgi:hypothetical protein